MRKLILPVALAALLAGCGDKNAPYDDANKATGTAGLDEAGILADIDREFALKVAGSNKAEVELGTIAEFHASNPEVKRFARRMVEDHGRSNDELKELANDLKLELPNELDPRLRETSERLATLQGPQFDREYMATMVEWHTRSIDTYEREIREGKNARLKAWAEKKLPTTREHYAMATELNQKLLNTR